MYSIISLFIAGLLGALIKDILQDNIIELPKKIDGHLVLGSLGGLIVGGAAGYFVDGSLFTAFLAGYSGTAVIESLIAEKKTKGIEAKVFVRGIIRGIARQYGVPENLAVRVAECESALSPSAVNINKDGSRDRGLYQINDKWHPEVSDKDAFDIMTSTKFFCEAYKKGMLHWWNATKDCWDKK